MIISSNKISFYSQTSSLSRHRRHFASQPNDRMQASWPCQNDRIRKLAIGHCAEKRSDGGSATTATYKTRFKAFGMSLFGGEFVCGFGFAGTSTYNTYIKYKQIVHTSSTYIHLIHTAYVHGAHTYMILANLQHMLFSVFLYVLGHDFWTFRIENSSNIFPRLQLTKLHICV